MYTITRKTKFIIDNYKINAVILPVENLHLKQLKKEISEYFEGKRKKFSVEMDVPGTMSPKSVWKMLQAIPYGETWSYQQQAIQLNKPNAVRAIANVNGHNRIVIIMPCHRVIGKDGHLTGYGGGLERKKWLLDLQLDNIKNQFNQY